MISPINTKFLDIITAVGYIAAVAVGAWGARRKNKGREVERDVYLSM